MKKILLSILGGVAVQSQLYGVSQLGHPESNCQREGPMACLYGDPAKTPDSVPEEFTIAFLGDSGMDAKSKRVMELIRDEGTDLFIHAGDIAYQTNLAGGGVQGWVDMIKTYIPTTPMVAVFGNHDTGTHAPGWQKDETYRAIHTFANEMGTCKGHTGVNYVCTNNGVTVVGVAPGTTGVAHESFISKAFRDHPSTWRVCVFHKTQRLMQVGSKMEDAVGWPVYAACRRNGAIILTGHEHVYARTHEMSSFKTQTVSNQQATEAVPLTLRQETAAAPGTSFVMVSGAGGWDVRNYGNGWRMGHWAASEALETKLAAGVGFCNLNIGGDPSMAKCYYKALKETVPEKGCGRNGIGCSADEFCDEYWEVCVKSKGETVDEWYVKTTVGEQVASSGGRTGSTRGQGSADSCSQAASEVYAPDILRIPVSEDWVYDASSGQKNCNTNSINFRPISGFRFADIQIEEGEIDSIMSAYIEFTIDSSAANSARTRGKTTFNIQRSQDTFSQTAQCGGGVQQPAEQKVPWFDVEPWNGAGEGMGPGMAVHTPDLVALVKGALRSGYWKKDALTGRMPSLEFYLQANGQQGDRSVVSGTRAANDPQLNGQFGPTLVIEVQRGNYAASSQRCAVARSQQADNKRGYTFRSTGVKVNDNSTDILHQMGACDTGDMKTCRVQGGEGAQMCSDHKWGECVAVLCDDVSFSPVGSTCVACYDRSTRLACDPLESKSAHFERESRTMSTASRRLLFGPSLGGSEMANNTAANSTGERAAEAGTVSTRRMRLFENPCKCG